MHEFNKMQIFVRFKIDFYCVDLIYVDKISKDTNGVNCLQVRQESIDRNVDTKRNKAKDSIGTVQAFSYDCGKEWTQKKRRQWTRISWRVSKTSQSFRNTNILYIE